MSRTPPPPLLFTLAACLLIGSSGAFAPDLGAAIRCATRCGWISGSGSSVPRRHRLVAGTAWRVAGRAQMCLQGGVGGGGAATGRETSGINSGEEGEERWVGAVIRNKIALREAVEVENFSMAAELRDRGRLLRAQDPVLGRMTSLAAAIAEEDFPRAAKLRG
ncbi:hypothetical protein T484DRAFT_1806051 [Baffinella frigidus]|nr:hypothetical protein T484DRAFT_1806051 [Cryptophyta sp. CCMP2293]